MLTHTDQGAGMSTDETHEDGEVDEFTAWRVGRRGAVKGPEDPPDPSKLVAVTMCESETAALMGLVQTMPELSEAAAVKSAAMIGAQLLPAVIALFHQGLHVRRQEMAWLKGTDREQAKIAFEVWEASLRSVAITAQNHVETIIAVLEAQDHEPAVKEG